MNILMITNVHKFHVGGVARSVEEFSQALGDIATTTEAEVKLMRQQALVSARKMSIDAIAETALDAYRQPVNPAVRVSRESKISRTEQLKRLVGVEAGILKDFTLAGATAMTT